MTQLNESLHAGDFEHMLRPAFSIDEFKSKLGADEDVVTVKFEVIERTAAQDLVTFIEKGYNFVLDADVAGAKLLVHTWCLWKYAETQNFLNTCIDCCTD